MKIFINQQKVKRRAQIANFASVGGLVLLLASVVIPFFLPAWANTAYVLMIGGLGVSMIGIYFANRWVRKPRPEESLNKALKSLDDQYRLFHYTALPSDHILLTPFGVIALETVNLAGNFSYRDGKWREAMTIGRALRYIVEERVSNPIISAQQIEAEFKNAFVKEFGSGTSVPVQVMFVFVHPQVQLELEHAPITICKVEKLKKQVGGKGARLEAGLYEKLGSLLESRTV